MPLGTAHCAVESILNGILEVLQENEELPVRKALARIGQQAIRHYRCCYNYMPFKEAERIFEQIEQERSP